ncbi:MAG: hypothetical protein ACHQF0_08680 [Chitinophagales bacterium]
MFKGPTVYDGVYTIGVGAETPDMALPDFFKIQQLIFRRQYPGQ